MRSFVNIVLAFLLLGLSTDLYSQVHDAGVWTGFGLKKEIKKDLQASLEIETRFNENWAEMASSFVDASLKRKLSKHFDVALNYRFGNKRETDNSYSLRQRGALDLSMDYDVWEFKLQYRARFQLNQKDLQSRERASDFDVAFESGWRNKFSAEIKLFKKTELDTSVELFLSEDEEAFYLSDVRYTTGISYKVKKRQYLKLGFLFQRELQAANPTFEYITTVGYSLELK